MFIYYTLPPFYELKLFNTCVSLSGVSHLLINRYKRLLCMVDLTKDFFFSYSFNIMRSFQKNICDRESGGTLYKKMFVWNEFLTRGIRHHLRNTVWTVALVYGFFKQVRIIYLSAPHCQREESFPESNVPLLFFSHSSSFGICVPFTLGSLCCIMFGLAPKGLQKKYYV